jgi:hypothetical protein
MNRTNAISRLPTGALKAGHSFAHQCEGAWSAAQAFIGSPHYVRLSACVWLLLAQLSTSACSDGLP